MRVSGNRDANEQERACRSCVPLTVSWMHGECTVRTPAHNYRSAHSINERITEET
jgi:hypothetical protein